MNREISSERDSPESVLRVRDVSKVFVSSKSAQVRALDHVSLEVAAGEFVVLLGPSGCGKTTLLRSIAGLETPTSGSITIGDEVVFSSGNRIDVPVRTRGVGMMFQSYALWPHMTVRQTVEFPLSVNKVPRGERTRRAKMILESLAIADLLNRYPHQLSGGQQQRVALARALAVNQHVILLDEPLSNVDAKVRELLRVELVRLQRELGFAAVFVTHDQAEAMELADRIVVMNAGSVQQLASPKDLYERPANAFVAKFIGSNNTVTGSVLATTAGGLSTIECPWGPAITSKQLKCKPGQRVLLTVRPERMRIRPESDPAGGALTSWRGCVVRLLFGGTHLEVFVALADGQIARVRTDIDSTIAEGQEVLLQVDPDDVNFFLVDESGA